MEVTFVGWAQVQHISLPTSPQSAIGEHNDENDDEPRDDDDADLKVTNLFMNQSTHLYFQQ